MRYLLLINCVSADYITISRHDIILNGSLILKLNTFYIIFPVAKEQVKKRFAFNSRSDAALVSLITDAVKQCMTGQLRQ